MKKLLSSLAATAALALFVSSAQADCAFHNQQAMASIEQPEEGVAMSTYDGPAPLPTAPDATVEAAATTECPAGQECGSTDK